MGREHNEFRGCTFSPAEKWFEGGPEFAFEKLEEISRFLLDLAAEADSGSRRRRRKNSQAFYDLEDAATTVSDAIALLRRELPRSATR